MKEIPRLRLGHYFFERFNSSIALITSARCFSTGARAFRNSMRVFTALTPFWRGRISSFQRQPPAGIAGGLPSNTRYCIVNCLYSITQLSSSFPAHNITWFMLLIARKLYPCVKPCCLYHFDSLKAHTQHLFQHRIVITQHKSRKFFNLILPAVRTWLQVIRVIA